MSSNFVKKPEWLRIKLGGSITYGETRKVIEGHCLHTICSSGRCPNQGECWSRGTATFMIGGNICTRSCRFCNTLSGRPLPLDPNEPRAVAESVRAMGLKHAVITSVDRDDLPDGGAHHWQETILAIRELNPNVTCEVLIPDFRGYLSMVDLVIAARPNIISHNLETVKRLTPLVRSVATYERSLSVLKHIAEQGIPAKTGIMLGLGETEEEILETMDDALSVGVSILTIGQYLRPSRKNIPVEAYIEPAQFDHLREVALQKGFTHVVSGPLVRSSYHAEEQVNRTSPTDTPHEH